MVIGEAEVAECHQSSYFQSASYPSVSSKLRTSPYNPSGMYGLKAMDTAAPEYEYPGKPRVSATSSSFSQPRARHDKEVRSIWWMRDKVTTCWAPLYTIIAHSHQAPTHSLPNLHKATQDVTQRNCREITEKKVRD